MAQPDDWETDRRLIAEGLSWPLARVRPGAYLSLVEMADLLGVTRETPSQWRTRTRRGELAHPMPDPDPAVSKPDKPLWTVRSILPWFKDTGRWPPGRIARPERRGPRSGVSAPAPVLFLSGTPQA